MPSIKLYKNLEPLTTGSTVRLDNPLFIAVMNEAVKVGIPSYADFVRAILAATCLDKTYGDITPLQGKLVAGNTYCMESDIQGYESQIETLKSRVSEYAHELNMKDVKLQNMIEQHQVEVAILKAKIPRNLPNLGLIKNESQSNLGNYNQSSQDQDPANKPVIPTNQNQSGFELSQHGMNKSAIEPIPINMEKIIQDKFLEVVENNWVIEYFNQQTRLNQSFGIAGFDGVFDVVEEIPNALLENHPLVVYWKKRVGQFENTVVNANEAFFKQNNTLQQMGQNEQRAHIALIQREQMLWWFITSFTTIRGFDQKYFNYLIETVTTQCDGFPVMPNPYHDDILIAQQ